VEQTLDQNLAPVECPLCILIRQVQRTALPPTAETNSLKEEIEDTVAEHFTDPEFGTSPSRFRAEGAGA